MLLPVNTQTSSQKFEAAIAWKPDTFNPENKSGVSLPADRSGSEHPEAGMSLAVRAPFPVTGSYPQRALRIPSERPGWDRELLIFLRIQFAVFLPYFVYWNGFRAFSDMPAACFEGICTGLEGTRNPQRVLRNPQRSGRYPHRVLGVPAAHLGVLVSRFESSSSVS